jgi:hypothetical protein
MSGWNSERIHQKSNGRSALLPGRIICHQRSASCYCLTQTASHRLKRISELITQKTAIDGELKTLKDQIAQESAAFKKPRKAKKQEDLPLAEPAKVEAPKAEAPKAELAKK